MSSLSFAGIPPLLAWQEFSGNGAPDGSAAAGVAMLIFVVGLFLAATIAMAVLVYYVLYSSVARIPPQFRLIEPGHVFLLLIPFFQFYWLFVVNTKIPQSFRQYFASIGRHDVGDCGEQLGLWSAILTVVSIIPCVNVITGPIASVMAIVLLIKFWGLRNQIPASKFA